MKSFTVLTPTFNRADTLPRVYQSLQNQTNQDFVWMIVDDGSTDNTEAIVNTWIHEKKIGIQYFRIKKGGQHKALQLGFYKAETKYLVKLDSDDAFLPDALKIYSEAWCLAEKENNRIGNITAMSVYENGKLIGGWTFPHSVKHIDSSWHEMVLKKLNNNELSNCTQTSILKEIYPMDFSFWLEEKTNIVDGVFAPRISKRCTTRYLNEVVQVVHTDAPFSSLRSMQTYDNKFWKVIVDNLYFLDENIEFFFWNPKYFIHYILKLNISAIICGVSLRDLFKKITSGKLKVWLVVFFPFSILAFFYFKTIKRSFWI